jgi:hypothetical protein
MEPLWQEVIHLTITKMALPSGSRKEGSHLLGQFNGPSVVAGDAAAWIS